MDHFCRCYGALYSQRCTTHSINLALRIWWSIGEINHMQCTRGFSIFFLYQLPSSPNYQYLMCHLRPSLLQRTIEELQLPHWRRQVQLPLPPPHRQGPGENRYRQWMASSTPPLTAVTRRRVGVWLRAQKPTRSSLFVMASFLPGCGGRSSRRRRYWRWGWAVVMVLEIVGVAAGGWRWHWWKGPQEGRMKWRSERVRRHTTVYRQCLVYRYTINVLPLDHTVHNTPSRCVLDITITLLYTSYVIVIVIELGSCNFALRHLWGTVHRTDLLSIINNWKSD